MIFVAVPILANVLERHHTHAEKEMRIMLTLSFFQCFNNILTVTVMLWVSTAANPNADGRFISGWYASGAALIINGLIGDLFVICIFVDGVRPQARAHHTRQPLHADGCCAPLHTNRHVPLRTDYHVRLRAIGCITQDMVRRRILAPAAKTQARMNELASIPADIFLSFRIQLLNKFLVLGLMYGFAIPILYLVVALYMWVSQWTDRINLLHRLAPPPATHDNQMQFVYKFLLPFAIALHVLMAVKFFYDICDGALEQVQGADQILGVVAAASQSLEQCSSSLSSGTICTQPVLFGPTLREEAAALLNGTLAPSPLSLLCISSNASGVVRSLCHVQTRGLSAVCGDNSWTSAKVSTRPTQRFHLLQVAHWVCLPPRYPVPDPIPGPAPPHPSP